MVDLFRIHQFPRVRADLVQAHRVMAANLSKWGLQVVAEPARSRMPPADVPKMIKRSSDAGDAIERSELWWVGRRMMSTIWEAAEKLPAWTPHLVAPCPAGIVVFGGPSGINVARVEADGSKWALNESEVAPKGFAPVVGAMWLTYGDFLELWALTTNPPAYTPLAIVGGQTLARIQMDGSDERLMDDPVVRMIGTLWSWADQPGLLDVEHRTLKGRRNMTTAGVPSVVKIVELGEHLLEPRSGAEQGNDESRYSHRWVVRGHWRQQPYGPGGTLRKPIWVTSHIKGPQDAPLIDKPTVIAIRH